MEGKQLSIEDFGVKIPETKKENVHHPQHYSHGGIECWDAMESAFGIEYVQHFCVCNAFKYIWRFLNKNGTEDIDKAVTYLNKWTELERKKVMEGIKECECSKK